MAHPVLARVVRRETHSPRTAAAVAVIVLVVAAAIGSGLEIVRYLLGAAPLLARPAAVLTWLAALPAAEPRAAVAAAAVAVAVVGAVLLWLAAAPGRRSVHVLGSAAHAVVVDDAAIAAAVAERVGREIDLPQGAVVVGIGHRTADVTVRPDLDQVVDEEHVREVAAGELAGYGPARMRVRVRVLRRGSSR